MSRLPFAEGPEEVDSAPAPWTVTELTGQIGRALGQSLPARVRVTGQVSNFNDRNHWFFSLKDEVAAIRCVCFASDNRRVSFDVEDGMEVVATGRVDIYPAQGAVQLYVNRLDPVGVGELELRFRKLCEELREKGYFDPARKKPLPPVARRVAVVTSRSAAALQDVIDTAQRRWAGCQLFLKDVRVQGGEAAGEIAQAIKQIGEQADRLDLDAIVVTRGGGSMEDLWAFNERVVADAIVDCPLPVVAAIGHETDTTVAELVADRRCATPTQAAMELVPDGRALAEQVDYLATRLAGNLQRRVERDRQRLESIARHPCFRRAAAMLEPGRLRLADLGHRLGSEVRRRVQRDQERLTGLKDRLKPVATRRLGQARDEVTHLQRQLRSVGPEQVLERGYSYTLSDDGRPVRNPADVSAGDRVTTVVAGGRFQSIVNADGADQAAKKPRSAARRKKKETDDVGSLFEPSE